jgi:hypothetical protein
MRKPTDTAHNDDAFQVLMSQADAVKRGALAIWTIYDRPKDFPDGFIARRFEVSGGVSGPTKDTITGKLEDIRQAFWKAGLCKLSREEGDEPQIVESWVCTLHVEPKQPSNSCRESKND